MIETPLRFIEVNEEFFFPDSTKFFHAKLRITPKRFDAVNMIFSSREFIFMVVNAVVLITICYQSIVRLPAVGINIAAFHNSALKNRHKLCLGTVFDDTQKHPSLSLMQAQNRDFPGRASSEPSWGRNNFHPLQCPRQMAWIPRWPYQLSGHEAE